jgi:hypothetical protein
MISYARNTESLLEVIENDNGDFLELQLSRGE